MGVLEALGVNIAGGTGQGGEGRTRVSIEVVPPGRGGDIEDILRAVEALMPHSPAFVSVTDHPAGRAWVDSSDEGREGPERVALRTKPGTLGASVALRDAFRVLTVPHVVASGAERLAVEDLLIDLHYAGFRDLFVVRGDGRFSPIGPASGSGGAGGAGSAVRPPSYAHAADLVAHVADLNRGIYSPPAGGRPTAFSVGVAGYPEKHFEAPNLASDLARLKAKVDAGAAYVITQMVFDPECYRRYVEALRSLGVTVPVIPGIKPLLRAASLASLPRTFHVDLPGSLVAALEGARSPADERKAGIDWAVGLCSGLLEAGAPCLHFFTMGRGSATRAVLDGLLGGGARS